MFSKTQSHKALYGVIFSLVLLLTSCNQEPEIRTLEGTLEQENPTWASLEGNWLVINYWAIWCTPCREEIPELNHLNGEINIQVLGVNYDKPPLEELKKHAAKLKVTFPTLLLEPAVKFNYPTPDVLPTTVLITPKGKLHKVLIGPQTKDSLLKAMDLLKEMKHSE